MREALEPFTRERFDELKARYEAAGYKVVSRWRKGLKAIRLGDIVLGERNGSTQENVLSNSVDPQREFFQP